MALPYDTKVVLPFDIATSQDMNERHANDVALAAGTGLNDGAVTASKIDLATLLAPLLVGIGSSIQTYTNTGDGGGTGYYLNLGGVKLCWGMTGSTSITGAVSRNVSLPVGFFTNVRTVLHDKFGSAPYLTQLGGVPTTSTVSVYFSSGTGSANIMWFVIGE